jgi:hypothetical protein
MSSFDKASINDNVLTFCAKHSIIDRDLPPVGIGILLNIKSTDLMEASQQRIQNKSNYAVTSIASSAS